jgi:folate-dependent phosphoribosylglycinamide formyltransferase PurN
MLSFISENEAKIMVLTEGIMNEDIGTVRLAYFLSTRELAQNEPLSDTGDPLVDSAVNASHRGNLPMVARMLSERAGGPDVKVALIVCDDVELMRDFSDLGIPLHQEPSTYPQAYREMGVERQDGETRADFRARLAPITARAKAAYEQRLLDVVAAHRIDMVISDRYMRLFGQTFLNEYLGLILNSHPAILPEIPGSVPTSGAIARARETGHDYTGITCHIIDPGEDTGPAVLQEENVRIYPHDTEASLRARNYQHEAGVLTAGILQHLRNPQTLELIRLRRRFVNANGDREQVLGRMREVRSGMLLEHRQAFEVFRRNRDSMRPGEYRYCFSRPESSGGRRRLAACG